MLPFKALSQMRRRFLAGGPLSLIYLRQCPIKRDMCEDEDEDEMAAVMMTAPWMAQRTRKDSESGAWAKSVVSGGTQGGRRLMVKCLLRDRDHFLDDGHSATLLYCTLSLSLARKESSPPPPLPDFLLFMGRWHPTSLHSFLPSWTRSDRACRNAVHVLAWVSRRFRRRAVREPIEGDKWRGKEPRHLIRSNPTFAKYSPWGAFTSSIDL